MNHKKLLIRLFAFTIISTSFMAFMPEVNVKPEVNFQTKATTPHEISISIDSTKPDIRDFVVFEKTTHDFGNVPANSKARYQFSFVNKSNEPVVIKKVKASCGCTAPSHSQEPVQPGETGYVVAVYSAPGSPQPFHKSITVETSHGVFILNIKGNVVAEEVNETPVRVN